MHIVQIEHPVADFDAWKKVFDSDPLGPREVGRAPIPDHTTGR
jgi:hypothetical protein